MGLSPNKAYDSNRNKRLLLKQDEKHYEDGIAHSTSDLGDKPDDEHEFIED